MGVYGEKSLYLQVEKEMFADLMRPAAKDGTR